MKLFFFSKLKSTWGAFIKYSQPVGGTVIQANTWNVSVVFGCCCCRKDSFPVSMGFCKSWLYLYPTYLPWKFNLIKQWWFSVDCAQFKLPVELCVSGVLFKRGANVFLMFLWGGDAFQYHSQSVLSLSLFLCFFLSFSLPSFFPFLPLLWSRFVGSAGPWVQRCVSLRR